MDLVFDFTPHFEALFNIFGIWKNIYKVLLSIASKSALVLDQYLFWFVFNGTLKNVCSGCMNCCYTDLWGHFDQWEDRIWSHEMASDQWEDSKSVIQTQTHTQEIFNTLTWLGPSEKHFTPLLRKGSETTKRNTSNHQEDVHISQS